jgi:hypothetical protein
MKRTVKSSRNTGPPSEKSAHSRRKLKRFVIAVLFTLFYVALDRTTVYFQMWVGISSWYPPSGVAVAILLGMGTGYAPLIVLASFIAAKVNYHQEIFSYSFIFATTAITGGYTATAVALRRLAKIDWHLRSVRDVSWLLFLALPASCCVALMGTLMLVLDHSIAWSEYTKAAMNWWAGEDRRRCFDAGMDGYVVKPVSAQSIRAEIERVMASQIKQEVVEEQKT